MRKFILLLSLFCSTILAVAQNQVNFKMQADVSFKAEDGKDFMVIPFEGKTAQELYAIVKKNVTTTYYSAKNVLNTVENEMISVNGVGKIPQIESKKEMSKSHFNQRKSVASPYHSFSIEYILVFRFKDGKIRIDAPQIIDKNLEITEAYNWSEKNNVPREDINNKIELELNDLCNKMMSTQNEDW